MNYPVASVKADEPDVRLECMEVVRSQVSYVHKKMVIQQKSLIFSIEAERAAKARRFIKIQGTFLVILLIFLSPDI
jgi:hypothetical protein